MLLEQFNSFQKFLEPSMNYQMALKRSRIFNMLFKLSKNLPNAP